MNINFCYYYPVLLLKTLRCNNLHTLFTQLISYLKYLFQQVKIIHFHFKFQLPRAEVRDEEELKTMDMERRLEQLLREQQQQQEIVC